MSEETVDAWLKKRTPEIPPVFLLRLLRGDRGDATWAELAERGEEALQAALQHPTEDRKNAFHLLAADAFLTYACEALARAQDVEAGLKTLQEGLGAGFA